jgi:gliding motility-associated-like protein
MLKSILLRVSFILFLTLSSFSSWSQCCCATNLGNISPNMTWQYLQHSCLGYVAFPAQAGCTYVFTYCNSVAPSAYYSGDTYLTINSGSPMAGAVAANDDYCGLGSYISWTAPATQTYYLQMGNWAQGASCACGLNRNLGYRSTNCVAGVQPPTGITASAMSVCQGQPVTLTATGTMGTQYWYTGSCGGTQIGTGASISVTPATTTTYYVNNNSGGQFSPSCASVTITVNPSPPAPTVSGNLTICGTGSTTLTASGSSGNYLWYSNAAGTNQLATTAAYTTPILTTTTTYYLAATSAPPNQVPGNWTFTNCGATSNVGPTQVQCNATYGPGVVTVTGSGTQRWTVPQSGMYTITGRGASGGNANTALGGQGRVIQIQVALTAGHQIGMIVGQQGGQLQFTTGYAGSGGGGTFVYNYTTNQPILVCGGGGGAGKGSPSWNFITNGGDAAPYNSTSGTAGLATPGSWCAVGAAGTGGNGGGGGNGGSGGGGLNGNGTQSTYGGAVGQSFISGGLGGTHTMYTAGVTSNVPGGFGGGAGAGGHSNYEANGGGGGGYSGGGGAACRVGGGGGGGNFFTGTYVSNSLNTGHGSVTIVGGVGGGNACISPIIPVTVVVNPQPTVTLTGTTICAGQSATLTANANIPGGTYVWSPGNLQGQSITVNPNTTTSYTVTYTTVGCPGATATATVTVNPMQPITGNLTICSGLTTQLANPVAPAAIPWSSSNVAVATVSANGLVTGISAGTATITFSSANGCQTTAIVTVDGTPLLTVTPNNIACFGGNGSVTLSASGGTAPFTYGATPTTNLAPGSYTYVATSASGCASAAVTITITQPQVGLTVSTTQTNVLCFGNSTGAINATPSGGTAPYTYSWSNGATTQNLTAIPSGSYTVTVTDANGCTATATVVITEPAAALAATTTQVMIACFGGNTGSVNMTPTGGTAPYTYVWTGGSTAQSAIGVPAGTYSVTVTDANGCTTTVTATITQPQAPLTLTNTQTNVLCFGNSTGAINLTPAGGTPAYSYLWSNNATTQNLTSLPAGTYTVVVTDANGCTANASVTITQPQTGLSVATTQTNVLCFGNSTGAINATPSGGSVPYTYSWSNNATTQNLTTIPSGSYTVTVLDANGCTATATAVITEPAAALAANTTQVNILCLNGVGSVNLTVSGGTVGYTYLWSNQATTEDLANLQAGVYTVVVTDANGCVVSATATILQSLSQVPVAINNLSGTTILTCANPIINLQATGGVTYTWTGGSSVSTAANSFTLPGQYTVNMIDPNGCPVSQNITLTQNVVLPPVQITNNSGATVIDCNNATINLSASGGGQYAWNNGLGSNVNVSIATAGTYTVVVTASNGCVDSSTVIVTVAPTPLITILDTAICSGQSVTLSPTYFPGGAGGTIIWSTAQSSPTITVSPTTTTTYNILYNYNGCPATEDVVVTVNQTPVVSVNNTTICLGDNAQLTATPNAPGGTFLWTQGGETTSSISISPASNTNYNVVYTLAGCSSAPATGVVTVNPIPTVSVNSITICQGDVDSLTATPNIPGGTYLWAQGGQTTSTIAVNPQSNSNYSVVYTLNGCVSPSAQGTVAVNPLPAAIFIADTLSGCAPLSVQFNADTTNQLATYQWSSSNGASGVGDQASLTFLNTGCYDITLTASMNGCVNSTTSNGYICVQENPIANFASSVNDFTQPNESVTFTNNSNGASGYIWSFGDGTLGNEMNPIHLYSGTNNGYTVTLIAITSMGCLDSTSMTIGYEETASYYIPNAFTPDGDKFNQTFRPIFSSGIDYQNYTMLIFNRWGEVVFETHNVLIGWDGSYGIEGLDAQPGVYTYQITVKIPETDERKIIAGHVNLLR